MVGEVVGVNLRYRSLIGVWCVEYTEIQFETYVYSLQTDTTLNLDIYRCQAFPIQINYYLQKLNLFSYAQHERYCFILFVLSAQNTTINASLAQAFSDTTQVMWRYGLCPPTSSPSPLET